MAVSVEAAFILLDKASGPLKEIRRQAELTDKVLNGTSGSTGFSGATKKIGSFEQALGDARKTSEKLTGEVTKAGREVEKTGNFFTRAERRIKSWGKTVQQTLRPLRFLTGALGGAGGALKGLVTALPFFGTAILALLPTVAALAGAVGALGVSLAAAAGGGAILGGGLLAAFGTGLASIAVIAKPAMTQLKQYTTLQKQLNVALASGSKSQIQAKQKQLDAFAKQHPGVAQLSSSLKDVKKQWDKLSAPGRASFFKLASDGISTLKADMPELSKVVNKNLAAIEKDFHKYLEPFLKSKAFTGFIDLLGSIFRKNLPGLFDGLTHAISGLHNILKVAAPTLDKFGGNFDKTMKHFDKFTGSQRGKGAIEGMIGSFKAWVKLLHEALRILGDIIGGTSRPGTKTVQGWADSLKTVADNLGKPGGTKGIREFFTRSLDTTGKLLPMVKNLVGGILGIAKILKPLGTVTRNILEGLPPGVITALGVGFLGFKALKGAMSGAKLGLSLFGKNDGSKPWKALWVRMTSGLGLGSKPGGKEPIPTPGGGAPGEKVPPEEPGGKLTSFGRKALKYGKFVPYVAAAVIAAEILNKYQDPVKTAKIPIPGGGYTYNPRVAAFATINSGRPVVPGTLTPARTGPAPIVHGGITPIAPVLGPPAAGTIFRASGPSSIPGIGPLGSSLDKLDKQGSQSVDHLHDHAIGQAKDMNAKVSDQIQTLKTNTVNGFQMIKQKGTTFTQGFHDTVTSLFQDMTKNMQTETGKQAGTISTLDTAVNTGLNTMIAQVDQALKSFGVGKMIAAVTKAGQGAAGGITAVAGHASGGRIPGRPSGDHVPLVGRGGGLLGIADGGELVVNRHTESRVNSKLARFGTSLGREVAGETRPHFSGGGRIPHLALGGTLSYGQLEGLWDKAGGPPKLAALMAAIAEAESGGRSGIVNSIGASGLWQIYGLPFPGNPLDPMTNARMAVAKYQSQGLGAWTTYTSGAYRQFLHGAVPAVGGVGGAAAPHIRLPGITGPAGGLLSLAQAVMRRGRGAAQRFINSKAPRGTVGLGGGPPMSGPAAVRAMIQEADQIAGHHYNYEWGGGHGALGIPGHGSGHGSGPGVGFDCSGAVSAVLGAAHLLGVPLTSGSFMGWGAPGPGKEVSIFASPSHVFMEMMGHYFGTSGMNPGGGAGWIPRFPESMPAVRHPPGLAMGGFLPGGVNWDELPVTDVQKLKRNPWGILPGMAAGGRIPWFAGGADFVARRPQIIGVGDRPGGERVTVAPTGQGRVGSPVHIEIHRIEVNRKGDVQKIVDEELRLLADSLEKQL